MNSLKGGLKKPDIIIDTNILYSALYEPEGVAGRIVDRAIDGECSLYAPDIVREEPRRNLIIKLRMAENRAELVVSALPVEWLPRTIYEKEIGTAASLVKHEADIPILASALALNLPIVSGNRHLHTRLVKSRVKMYKPSEFLGKMSKGKKLG